MDDLELYIYLALGAIYFLSRAFRKKKPVTPPQNQRRTDSREGYDQASQKEKPVSFEDLLREFTGQKAEPEYDNEDEYNWLSDRPDRAKWLDPCAGGDKENEMSYPTVINQEFEPEVMNTIDIRKDSRADMKCDYLKENMRGYDVIITNPPFILAKEIIEKALREVNDNGYVVMLLRLNFFGSKARKAFFKKQMPINVYVHNRRMSFTKDGKTDSIEYFINGGKK